MDTLSNRGFVILEISKNRMEAIKIAFAKGLNPIAAAKEIGIALEETIREFVSATEELNALYPDTTNPNEIGDPALALNALDRLETIIDTGVAKQSLSLALSEEEIAFLKQILGQAKSAIAELY